MSAAWMLAIATIAATPPEPPAVAPLPVESGLESSERPARISAAVVESPAHEASAAKRRTSLAGLTELDGDQLVAECERAVRKTAERAEPDPAEMVPRLAALYDRLSETTELGAAEATRLQKRIAYRLQQLQLKLKRTIARSERDAARSSKRVRKRGGPPHDRSLAAGRDVANARALIDLIQSTIAPESWQKNGGNGSIRYYAPLKVLVVRQTTEVHYQLRGTLDQLRK